MKKALYQTKQMKQILDYLKSVQGNHVTVNEIYDHFQKSGISVGTTTIYRHLERMVKDGTVAKYTVDGNSSACFEYLGEDGHCHNPVCFHCKCEMCGKLIHLQCNELAEIGVHLESHHHFQINSLRTVFYGLCEDCQKRV